MIIFSTDSLGWQISSPWKAVDVFVNSFACNSKGLLHKEDWMEEEDLVINVTVEIVFVILFACFVRQARRLHKGCQSNQLENSRKFSFFSDTTTCPSLRCFMPCISQVSRPTCCIAALEDILNIIQLLHILYVWSFFLKTTTISFGFHVNSGGSSCETATWPKQY